MSSIHTLDPDTDLVRRIGKGRRSHREAALRELMERHAPRLHGVAARMLGDAALAEDVVQETFLKAWNKAADWQPGRARFGTWLGRVTVNRCLDHLRKVRPLTGVELPERADPAPPADQHLAGKQRTGALRAAMTALPERQRAALALSLEGTSQAEAAQTLKITQGAYESLLVRARRTLRAEMTKEMKDAV